MKIKPYSWTVLTLFLWGISLLLTWLNQHSINAYWQQTYHSPSVLSKLDEFRWWRWGGELKAWLDPSSTHTTSPEPGFIEDSEPEAEPVARHAAFGRPFVQGALNGATLPIAAPASLYAMTQASTRLNPPVFSGATWQMPSVSLPSWPREGEPAEAATTAEVVMPETPHAEAEESREMSEGHEVLVWENPAPALPLVLNEPTAESAPQVHQTEAAPHSTKVRLAKNDMVFFAGDSLMQGVAPYMQQWLTRHEVKSLNLSKQSTGLSYPKFFDWPATIEETLRKYPEIKLLVVFLGPNDPWDFPNPSNPKSKYLRFQESEWETVYRQRVSRILETARQSNVEVMWLQIPHMRANKLNTQMRYLNQVLESETQDRARFIPIQALLSAGKEAYRDTILIDGKETRVRSKDGIHFTPSGMKLIANYMTQYIEFYP